MKIVEVCPREGFKLYLRQDDGVAGEVDLSALAGQGVFAAWWGARSLRPSAA